MPRRGIGADRGPAGRIADPAALTHLGYVALASMGSLVSHFALVREHARWAELPKIRTRVHAASEHPLIVAAQCPDYAYQLDEFFELTGSAFPTLAQSY